MTETVVVGAALAFTVLLSFEIYHFNHAYRRSTGDHSYAYLSPNRWRLMSLFVKRHRQPELARLQTRVAVVAGLWLASVIAVAVLSW